MAEYLVRYNKEENLKYISHLDFVRAFSRTMRRADFPIAYSEGFNPHPKISFALPLPTGYTSVCELIEIATTRDMTEDEILSTLNAAAPIGLVFTSAKTGKLDMKLTSFALYTAIPENMPDSVENFLAMREIIIPKKTKSGIKDTDIRGDIHSIEIAGNTLKITVAAGTAANLKPDVVVAAMNKYIDGYGSGDVEYCREKLYDKDMNEI